MHDGMTHRKFTSVYISVTNTEPVNHLLWDKSQGCLVSPWQHSWNPIGGYTTGL